MSSFEVVNAPCKTSSRRVACEAKPLDFREAINVKNGSELTGLGIARLMRV